MKSITKKSHWTWSLLDKFNLKTCAPLLLGAALLAGAAATPALANSANRSLPATYQPGQAVQAQIAVVNQGFGAIEERPPAGWTISNISNEGQYNADRHEITWLFLSPVTTTVSYTATPPAGASGPATFEGSWSVDGSAPAAIGGDTTINSDGGVDPLPGPTITTHPQSVTVPVGGTATFNVVATGTGDLTYQWRRNGTAIDGATAATYTIQNVTQEQAGSYTVAVTDSEGTRISNAAVLTVGTGNGGGVPGTQLVINNVQAGLPGLWNLSGAYTEVIEVLNGTLTLNYVIVHEGRGRLTGSGTATFARTGDDPLSLTTERVNVRGTVRSAGNRQNVRLRVDAGDRGTFDGRAGSYRFRIDSNMNLDEQGNVLSGTSNISADIPNERHSIRNRDATINLPAGLTGDWNLAIDVNEQTRLGTGNAVLTTGAGQTLPFTVSSRERAGTIEHTLRGTGDARGSTITVRVSPQNQIQAFRSNVLRQNINVTN
jgi:hypothetical protein